MKIMLRDQAATLVKYNPRSELHGEEREPAADVTLEFHAMNQFLDFLDPELKETIFKPSDDGDLAEKGQQLGALRFPMLEQPLKFANEMDPAVVTIRVAGDKSDIRIEPARVNAVQVEGLNGGTVKVKLRVQFAPTEKLGGKLSMLDHKDVRLTVVPGQEVAEGK